MKSEKKSDNLENKSKVVLNTKIKNSLSTEVQEFLWNVKPKSYKEFLELLRTSNPKLWYKVFNYIKNKAKKLESSPSNFTSIFMKEIFGEFLFYKIQQACWNFFKQEKVKTKLKTEKIQRFAKFWPNNFWKFDIDFVLKIGEEEKKLVTVATDKDFEINKIRTLPFEELERLNVSEHLILYKNVISKPGDPKFVSKFELFVFKKYEKGKNKLKGDELLAVLDF